MLGFADYDFWIVCLKAFDKIRYTIITSNIGVILIFIWVHPIELAKLAAISLVAYDEFSVPI